MNCCVSRNGSRIAFAIWLLPLSPLASADALRDCLLEQMEKAAGSVTADQMRAHCNARSDSSPATNDGTITSSQSAKSVPLSAARQRLIEERSTQWSPHVLTAYKQNYILPYTYVDEQNSIYNVTGDEELADNQEAKFQISFKFPLNQKSLLIDGDALHFGFTLKSFWQVYNDELSAPFRETNYNPDVFYTMPLLFNQQSSATSPNESDMALRFGVEHESNGRTQLLSRSWNRAYMKFFYAKDNYLVTLKPWYRIPEDEKDSPTDADGDDNPDIERYLGYFELTGAVKYRQFEFSTLLRNNLRSDNFGAIELGVSFPLWGRLRGYAQYFNGYGESLIDYNHRIERIGVGFLLTDLM